MQDLPPPIEPDHDKQSGRRHRRKATLFSFMKKVATLAVGTAGGQAAMVISSPFLARIFTPEEYGISGMAVALVLVVAAFATLKYEIVIVAAASHRDAANAIALTLLLLGATIFLLIMGLIVSALWFTKFGDGMDTRLFILAVTPAMLAAAALDTVLLHKIMIRTQRLKRLSMGTFANGLSTAVFQAGFGLAGLGAWGIVLGRMLGHTVTVIILIGPIFRETASLLRRHVHWSRMMFVARTHYRQAVFLAPAAGLMILAAQSPVFLLPATFGAAAAGAFYFGNSLALAGLVVYRQTLPPLTLREAVRRREVGLPFAPFLAKLLAVIAVPAFTVAIALSLYSVPFVVLVFGEQWSLAGKILGTMGFSYAAQAIYAAASATVPLLNAQFQNMLTQLLRLGTTVAAILVGSAREDLDLAIGLLAGSNVVIYFISVMMILWRTVRDDRARRGR